MRTLILISLPILLAMKLVAQPPMLVTGERMTLGTETNRSASVRAGDLDADGDLDIVVANGRHWPQQNYVFLNAGKAKFSVMRPLGADRRTTYACELGDLDGDGDLDIATGNDLSLGKIWLNDGLGNFALHTEFGEISSVRSVTISDVDNDGDNDLLVTCRGRSNQIYLNDGKANFRSGPTFGTPSDSTIDVAVADINRDDRPDLLLANRDGQPNEILMGDRDLKFLKRVSFGSGKDNTRAIAVADLDSDGALDWVAGNIGQSNQIYFGDGSGGIRNSIAIGAPNGRTYAVATADIDGDGDLDVVAGNVRGQNSVAISEGLDGQDRLRFREEPFGDPDAATYGLCLGDLNGDGLTDVVVANSDGLNRFFFSRSPIHRRIQP